MRMRIHDCIQGEAFVGQQCQVAVNMVLYRVNEQCPAGFPADDQIGLAATAAVEFLYLHG